LQSHHWLMLAVVAIAAYYIGANYKLGLPVLG
jgi:hypothetical protein